MSRKPLRSLEHFAIANLFQDARSAPCQAYARTGPAFTAGHLLATTDQLLRAAGQRCAGLSTWQLAWGREAEDRRIARPFRQRGSITGVHLCDRSLLRNQLLGLAVIAARLARCLLWRLGRFLRGLRSGAQRHGR